jgi:hypothetical protein
MPDESLKKTAFPFVLTIGIVNLFADMAYAGTRANVGPFLATLGANAAIVGLVAGSGELLVCPPVRFRIFRRPDSPILGRYLRRLFH